MPRVQRLLLGLRSRLLRYPRLLRSFQRIRDGLLGIPTPRPELREWHRIEGDKTLRLDYDLGPGSVVLDVGGFEGQWASDIVAMYGCQVHVFEPVPAYAERISRRFASNPLVTVHRAGLAPADGTAALSMSGDASSHERNVAESQQIEIELRGVDGFFAELGREHVDLVKLNIEGAEYDLVARLIDTRLIERIGDLQVQFHDFVPNAERRRRELHAGLANTHHPTWSYDFVWENWRRGPKAARGQT